MQWCRGPSKGLKALLSANTRETGDINTVLCLIKVKSNPIEHTMQ